MFRNSAAAVDDLPQTGDEPAADLVPVSHLELDLAAPVDGWLAELERRGVEIVEDDIGRQAVARDVARMLISEHRENLARQREAVERNERLAEQRDREFRARLWGGIPADHLPIGVAPAAAMLQAAKDLQPKRMTPLQHALSNTGEMVYHSLSPVPDGDES
jgi:hypothetical protein